MILVGSQRGGGQDLAAHLMRTDENEHVEIHEIRGFAGASLPMAFKEAQAISKGTSCEQYLFSLSLNPPQAEAVPVTAFEQAIDKVESKLGLAGQPRAIVFHEKEGRRHAHCVWSRIDADAMKARQLPFFKTKLQDVSRELYLEHNWEMPRGLENPALRDPTNFTLDEWQQAKRADVDPREIKQAVQDSWSISDSRAGFEHALSDRGFFLARGDRRGYVVMDYRGEIYSLPRLLGLKTKDVTMRLGAPDQLRGVEATKRKIAVSMTPAVRRHIQTARLAFKQRAVSYDHNRAVMAGRHQIERIDLKKIQSERARREVQERAARFRKGVLGLWDRVTDQHGKIKRQNIEAAAKSSVRDNNERHALIAKQLAERRQLQSRIKTQRGRQAKMLGELRRDVGLYMKMGAGPPAVERNAKRRRRTRSLDP